MPFILQVDVGGEPGANAYIDVPFFKDYHGTRGNTYGTPTDEAIQAAIVRATDYVDGRFAYVGIRCFNQTQLTQWPRVDAIDADSQVISGVPVEVKNATAEMALRALTLQQLVADPTVEETGAPVVEKTVKVGPVETVVKYGAEGQFQLPHYPLADMMLRRRGLVRSARSLRRV